LTIDHSSKQNKHNISIVLTKPKKKKKDDYLVFV